MPSCDRLRELENDETLLVQSGKPVGIFRTHENAPRVLISNSMLVPKWATWDEFRRLEALGLTMYGQMTAGSWIYIGTQGILQGTYETFAAVRRPVFRRDARGQAARDGRTRRHGRRPAARRNDERCRLPRGGGRPCTDREAAEDGYVDEMVERSTKRSLVLQTARELKEPKSVALLGNAAEVLPELLRGTSRWMS